MRSTSRSRRRAAPLSLRTRTFLLFLGLLLVPLGAVGVVASIGTHVAVETAVDRALEAASTASSDRARAGDAAARIHDVKCAIRHLRAKSGDYGADGRIVVWGSSAGGHLASMLGVTDASSGLEGNEGFSGTSSHVDAVAPIGSISDITGGPDHTELPFALGPGGSGEQTFGASWPGPNQVLTDASPITWVGSNDAPFYIVHGDQDATVLYPQATRLNTALSAAGGNTQLLTVANGGHNLNDVGMGTPSHTLAQVADMIADFFDLHVD